jgi:uncharacterized membrane protein
MPTQSRIVFLDALRAFAILMMLQGHWISGLLDVSQLDTTHWGYRFWLYCRGFTAPAFFTLTGWVFCFLLLRNTQQGTQNPRIKKGLKRAVELLIWGYLLRLNLPSLLYGSINPSFFQPDVLHIIGLSLFFIILIYRLFFFLKGQLGWIFLFLGIGIFILEPLYNSWNLDFLPPGISGYLVKGYGGVFYLFPWLGYVFWGAAIAYFFKNRYSNYQKWGLSFLATGLVLIFLSSSFFQFLGSSLQISLFQKIAWNNFLFIRLGDVLVLLAFFMLFQAQIKAKVWRFIGARTLELYIVHYFILYGSITGYGVYKFYAKELLLWESILSLLFFLGVCIGIVFVWKRKNHLP